MSHITFTFEKGTIHGVFLSNQVLPPATSVEYLGLMSDKRPARTEHTEQKRSSLDSRHKSFSPLPGKHSKPSLKNILLLYKSATRANADPRDPITGRSKKIEYQKKKPGLLVYLFACDCECIFLCVELHAVLWVRFADRHGSSCFLIQSLPFPSGEVPESFDYGPKFA